MVTTVKRTAALILAALWLAALPGCNMGLPDEVAACDYAHRNRRFAMNVPAGWHVQESRGVVSAFVVAPDGGAGRANVTVTVEPAGRFRDIEALARFNRQRTGRLPGLQRLETGRRTLADGHEAALATFEHAATGEAVRQQQLCVLADGLAYTVTATAAPPEAFEAYRDAFEIVFRSFRAAW